MASTRNYIDRSERLFSEAGYFSTNLATLWTTNDIVEADPVIYQDYEFGSLLVKDGVSCSVYFNKWNNPLTDVPSQFAITTDDESTDFIEFFCWVRPTKNCLVTVKTTLTKATLDMPTMQFMLSSNPLDVIQGQVGHHDIAVGLADEPRWHIVRAVPVQIPDDASHYSISVEITVTYEDAVSPGVMNISRPTAIRTNAMFESIFLSEAASFIPDVFLGKDFANFTENEPTYPLMRLLDVMTNSSNDVYLKHNSIEYLDVSEGFSPLSLGTFSTLIEPALANGQTLEWLAQFRGKNLVVTYEPSTEGEPWDLFVLDESTLDGDDVVATTTTPTTGFAGGLEEYFKWQVETGSYGHNAGTIPSMLGAIKLLLTGGKKIYYSVSANTINFFTLIDETFGAELLNIGDPSPFVTSILEPTRPLGMIINHELIGDSLILNESGNLILTGEGTYLISEG